MIDLDAIWAEEIGAIDADLLARRPDFRFDPDFYAAISPDVSGGPAELGRHYKASGKSEGRPPTRFRELRATHPKIAKVIKRLVIDDRLGQAIVERQKGAVELAFELMRAGRDAEISDFSASHYLSTYPDIAKAGVDPLEHYLTHGHAEKRTTLAALRKDQHPGAQEYDPLKPTCLIAMHEYSNTGAPHVGIDLAREAARTHNVIVAGLRGGTLLDAAAETACEVVVSPNPLVDFEFFRGEVFKRIDVAVLNSVETHPFIKFAVSRGIPFAAYIHEYSWYTFPPFKTIHTAMFADVLVFSSQHVADSWAGVMADMEVDPEHDVTVIPQRAAGVGAVHAADYREAREHLSTLLGVDCTDKRIVCGAGHAQWRKGTDIFAMAAQIARHRDPDTIFVWVGDGIKREDTLFGAWMTHHLKQARAGDPAGNLFFLPAGPHYSDVLAAADAMLMSSRLDPLPNVVFDALAAACRVVIFEGGTGFNDAVYQESGFVKPVEFGNPDAAATALLSLPRKQPSEEPVAPIPRPQLFRRIVDSLDAHARSRTHLVVGPTPLDVPVLYTSDEADRARRIREREKLFTNHRRYIWRDAADARDALATSDNWVHQAARIIDYKELDGLPQTEFSIHLHAYYVGNVRAELESLRAYQHARTVVVTTDTDKKRANIERIMGDVGVKGDVIVLPNQGRDILPFMRLFGPDGPGRAGEVWAHLHQKESAGTGAQGTVWRAFLNSVLLGSEETLSAAVDHFTQPDVGLVGAFDPFYGQWNANRDLLHLVDGKVSGPLPSNPMTYPIGNMFWVRGEVVHAMNDLFGEGYSWPNEPIDNDGTEFHLIERLWPVMAAELGLTSVYVSKPDAVRRH